MLIILSENPGLPKNLSNREEFIKLTTGVQKLSAQCVLFLERMSDKQYETQLQKAYELSKEN